MRIAKPFNEDFTIPYQKIGREQQKKKQKKRDIENLRNGKVTENQAEIDLCLSCPYPECVSRCKRLEEFRGAKLNV